MNKKYTIFNQDTVKWANKYKGEKFHALLTDAPYHLQSIVKRFGGESSAPAQFGTDGVFSRSSKGFMGQRWDGGDVAFRSKTWEAFSNVLYDGAFGMAFSASRNWHRMAVAIEDAGFIIHPTMFFLWVQGQGFPKATRVKGHEEFDGHRYGAQALKPATEPVIVFSKSKGLWYTSVQSDMNEVSNLLGELWKPENQSEIAEAAQEVNTILLRALDKSDQTYLVSGANAETAKTSFTYPQQLSETRESAEANTTVPENAIATIGENSQKESVVNAENSFTQKTQENSDGIVVLGVDMPPKNALCWRTPFEMGIDIDTLVGILQSNSEKAELDLSMIWLWSNVWADVCELVNKSTIEMSEKTITALKILNYSLQRLTQTSIQYKRSSTKEQWLYAQDVARNFIGLLTSLTILEPIAKPAVEPIIIFQKPYSGKPVENIVATGAGAMNIDGGRIPLADGDGYVINEFEDGMKPFGNGAGHEYKSKVVRSIRSKGIRSGSGNFVGDDYKDLQPEKIVDGRWPANLVLDEGSAEAMDLQSGNSASPKETVDCGKFNIQPGANGTMGDGWNGDRIIQGYADNGGASRYFYTVQSQIDEADPFLYCKKVSPKERNAGLDELPSVERRTHGEMNPDDTGSSHNTTGQKPAIGKNPHPTLKPIQLAKHLATLLLPPASYSPRRLFVPFSGVASEMIGGLLAGWDEVVGVEFDTENGYVEIAEKRLQYYCD